MKTKLLKSFTMMQVVIFVLTFSMSGCNGCNEEGKDKGLSYPVTLLQTTDMHARASGVGPFLSYTPMDTADNDSVLGGFARLASKIKEIRTAKTDSGSAVMLVDSGDYTMGTVYDFLWDTDPASLKFIQEMGYDLITLGNHEFDYGPAKLAAMINASSGFDIPIVASNTVFSTASAEDDDLEDLKTAGSIVPTYVITLPDGLKIGFIGLMGKSSSDDSPNAAPVTFRYDYAGADKTYVQGIVDDLRSVQGADVVIALSHSGLILETDPDSGDDITLAQNITGIDIIASGHDHEMTAEIIDVPNTTNPENITHIFCAGEYTTNLAQLDFTATRNGVTGLVLTNHTIDDAIPGDSAIDTMVNAMNTAINGISGIPDVTVLEATMGDFPLSAPSSPGESGLGNLLADSLRYAGTEGTDFTIGVFARGVIRDNFIALQEITFADLFAMVPLGITTATDQGNSYPGYPLLKVYLTGSEIWDMCKFNAKIMQFNLYTQNFVHLSGIQYTHNNAGVVSSVNAYAWDDYTCTDTALPLPQDSTLYPCIIDSYVMAMLLSPSIQDLLANPLIGVSIHPKLVDGSTLVSATNMLDTRLDKDGVPGNGVQEYYAWSALIDYFTYLGADIPLDPYNLPDASSARIND